MPDLNDKPAVPVHVGIIMDGNGRWAQQQGFPRTQGHKVGAEVAKKIILRARDLGVKYLTLYTFSTENWSRPKAEVDFIMNLLSFHLKTERDFYTNNGIRLLHLGDISRLSKDLQHQINAAVDESKNNDKINLVFAINHGGRDELIRTINKIKADSSSENITEESLRGYLDLPEVPDADLIIRTGGEQRLSNFLLWHSAYAELEFSDKLWPDYTPDDFEQNIQSFAARNRRFGGVK